MTTVASPEILISADAHVGEPEALRERMPERLRSRFPRMRRTPDGDLAAEIEGELLVAKKVRIDARARELEFRSDPSLGTDLDVRYRDMAREGVDAQVVFPNFGLEVNNGREPAEFHQAWARAHNDFVSEVFAADRKRFKLAAMLAVDDVSVALAEARRCVGLGFETLFLPCTVPWQPYRLDVYEPLCASRWNATERLIGSPARRSSHTKNSEVSCHRYEPRLRPASVAKPNPSPWSSSTPGLASWSRPMAMPSPKNVVASQPMTTASPDRIIATPMATNAALSAGSQTYDRLCVRIVSSTMVVDHTNTPVTSHPTAISTSSSSDIARARRSAAVSSMSDSTRPMPAITCGTASS